jgi:hypothetical protein
MEQVNQHVMLQEIDSYACGYYCVPFLYWRIRFRSTSCALQKFVKLASTATSRDKEVVGKVHKLMHEYKCITLPSNVMCTRFTQVSHALK